MGGDIEKLIYVDRLGGNNSDRAFMCDVRDCACRYHMRYTRGFEARGVDWGPLAALQFGKVAAQKGILEKKLEEEGLSEKLNGRIRTELGIIINRWGNSREEDADQEKRHLLTSQERVDIQLGTRERGQ